jgi:hypothetical protein
MFVRIVWQSAVTVLFATTLAGAQDPEALTESDAPPAAPTTQRTPDELSQFQLQLMRDFERYEKSL